MGVKAVFTKVKENLPEIPDLIYDYLKAGKENQHNQAQLMQKMLAQQAKLNQRLIVAVLAAGLLIAQRFFLLPNG
mgnify:CR=1 FL=1